ncbi:MAG: ABC transporter ATP-binding protein [Bacilli bacterium]
MIKIDKLTKSFGKRTVLNEISVEIPDDSITAFIGESGSGKTTILNLISMVDHDFEGDIIVDDKSLKDISKKQYEKKRVMMFSYVFSNAFLLPYLSIVDNILLPTRFGKQKVDSQKLEDYISYFKMDFLLKSKVDSLSEGEKQRVAILRALAYNRKYIICDEPTAHLDPENAKLTFELLKDISRKYHKTVIVSLHDYSSIALFDSVWKIQDGKLHEIKQ